MHQIFVDFAKNVISKYIKIIKQLIRIQVYKEKLQDEKSWCCEIY